EHFDGGDAEQDRDQRPWDRRREPAQPDDHRERQRADEQRQPLGVAEVGDDVPQLLKEVARALPDPQQLRDLADDDRQGEADDEAFGTGLGDEAGEEPEPEYARDERRQPGRDGQAGRQRREAIAPHGDQRGDRGRRQRSGGGHGSDNQLA